MDYRAAGFWLDVLQWMSIGVVAVWGYLRTKDKDNADAIRRVAAEVAGNAARAGENYQALSLRLATVEERLKHMPTSDEMAQIEGDVSEVRAKVDGIEDLLKRVEHQTNLIHQHLLNGR